MNMAHDRDETERRAFVRARAWVLAMMGAVSAHILWQLLGG